MAQLFLDVLGKKGMLVIWSLIIVVQARQTPHSGNSELTVCPSLLQERRRVLMRPGSSSPSHETMHFPAPGGGSK